MAIRDHNRENTFIYDRATGQKIQVSKEIRDAYYRDAARIRMKEQAHGRCACPKHKAWLCDGDCALCKYWCAGDIVSLDDPVKGEYEDTFGDVLPSQAPAFEDIIEDRDLLDCLFSRLRELDPDADVIINAWLSDTNASDRSIAKTLGRPQRTFVEQMKMYRAELRRILED